MPVALTQWPGMPISLTIPPEVDQRRRNTWSCFRPLVSAPRVRTRSPLAPTNATLTTSVLCPASTAVVTPLSTFQIRAVLSEYPVTSRVPSLENTAHQMLSLLPVNIPINDQLMES